MKPLTLSATALLLVTVVACGDASGLTEAEREWCTVEERTEDAAIRFDEIFEAGLELELNMDVINATAARLLDEYLAEGMSDDEAVAAVSRDLLDDPSYIAACKRAYEHHLEDEGAG